MARDTNILFYQITLVNHCIYICVYRLSGQRSFLNPLNIHPSQILYFHEVTSCHMLMFIHFSIRGPKLNLEAKLPGYTVLSRWTLESHKIRSGFGINSDHIVQFEPSSALWIQLYLFIPFPPYFHKVTDKGRIF